MTGIVDSLKAWRVWLHMGNQDLKNRFRRSVLGPVWLLINLAVFAGAIGLIYGALFNLDVKEFLPYLVAGFVIWGFIVSSLIEGGSAFIISEGYIHQIPFPKQVYIFRQMVTYTIILFIGLFVFLVFSLILGRTFRLGMLWVVPGILLLLLAGTAHVFIMAYLVARFRDLGHALGTLMQVLFLLTPIIYPVEILEKKGIDFIYLFNPFYYLIEIVRYPLMHSAVAPVHVYLFTLGYVGVMFFLAYIVGRFFDKRIVYWL